MIRLIEEEFLKLEKTDNFIIFKLKNITFEHKENKTFTKELERELELNRNKDYKTKLKEMTSIRSGDYVIIENGDETYSLIKLNSEPFLIKEGIKIEVDKIVVLANEIYIPTALRMDNRTKQIKLKRFETKEQEELNSVLEQILKGNSEVYRNKKEYFMDKKRQASASIKGYVEQSRLGLAYVFYNENYKKINEIKIEGALEDIEIETKDGKKDYIQVKIAEFPQNEDKFEEARFMNGLDGLKSTYEKAKAYDLKLQKLIYASNVYYQPIKRLTNLILEGKIINKFIGFNELLPFEKEELEEKYKIIKELKEKLYFLRMGPEYLSENLEFPEEYNNLVSILGIENFKRSIYKDLREKFVENSCIREERISIFEIAYEFLRKSQSDDSFNQYYEEELEQLDVQRIEEFLKEKELYERVKEYIRQDYIIDKYVELEQKFDKELKIKVLKEFLDLNYNSLDEYNLFSMNLKKPEKEILYKYILYSIFKNRKLLKEICKEFCLE